MDNSKTKIISEFVGVTETTESWDCIFKAIEKIESLKVNSIDEDGRDVIYSFRVVIAGNQCLVDRGMLPQFYGTEHDFLKLYDCTNSNKKESTIKAIISFIKWYNKTRK